MLWVNIFRGIVLLIGIVVIAFDAELYIYCKKQSVELNSLKDRLDVESEFNGNKFKYQQQQIESLRRDLDDARQQIKNQNDENKSIQTSLVDIEAEADAIKQDMKGWQKDYVTVLAKLEKKMEDSQSETKGLEENLAALNIPELKEDINSLKTEIEKSNPPVDNSLTATTPATPDQKTGSPDAGTQQ